MRCHKCHGLMVYEYDLDIDDQLWRCVNCSARLFPPLPTVRVERVEPGTCYICGKLPRHMDWEICYRCSAVNKAHERKRAQHDHRLLA